MWGASIVEITLTYFIKLWELRNEEVHGKTVEQQESTRKTKLSIDARKLNDLKDKARPVDMGLFHADKRALRAVNVGGPQRRAHLLRIHAPARS